MADKSPFISSNKSIDNLIHPVMSMNPVPWHKSLWDNNDQTLTIMNKDQGLTLYLLTQQWKSRSSYTVVPLHGQVHDQ